MAILVGIREDALLEEAEKLGFGDLCATSWCPPELLAKLCERSQVSDGRTALPSLGRLINNLEVLFQKRANRRIRFTEAETHDYHIVTLGNGSQILCANIVHAEVLLRLAWTAPSGQPVLLFGETGTGKENTARYIHDASNRIGAFISVNCASIPHGLAEAELFGAVDGAGTLVAGREGFFRLAHRGTLFLDEVAELSLELQAKLLRVLEYPRIRPVGSNDEVLVDVRVVAATNCDLRKMVAEGKFRQDLYYRLVGEEVELPPLRERISELLPLASLFLARAAHSLHARTCFRYEAIVALAKHPWPGNIRELAAVVTRGYHRAELRKLLSASVQESGGPEDPAAIGPADLGLPGAPAAAPQSRRARPGPKDKLTDGERAAIQEKLRSGTSQKVVAAEYNVNASTISRISKRK